MNKKTQSIDIMVAWNVVESVLESRFGDNVPKAFTMEQLLDIGACLYLLGLETGHSSRFLKTTILQ